MGSSKKRKEKAKDFAKAKLKLGKGKQKAANATDISFSARSIALSQQTIGREHREGVPTTKRNLSLEDLQIQLKHYSANTRKDAIAGLRELLTSYPEVAYASVSSLVPLLARLIGDDDASVRKALLAFLQWYLPALPAIILEPHHSVLIFFTTSALSHIYPEVRIDAVRVLNLLLDVCRKSMLLDWTRSSEAGPSSGPAYQDQSHSQTVLECYLALLHIRSGVATNGLRTDMSPASKALILSSLAKFLRLSLTPDGSQSSEEMDDVSLPEVPMWYLADSFSTHHDYVAFVQRFSNGYIVDEPDGSDEGFRLLSTSLMQSGSAWALSDISAVGSELKSVAKEGQTTEKDASARPEELLPALLPIFVAAFLDAAPTAFAPGTSSSASSDVPLETVLSVTESARDLWRSIMSSRSQADAESPATAASLASGVEKLVGYMATYFPFGSDELAKRPMAQELQLQRLNIAYCELISLLHISQTAAAGRKRSVESEGQATSSKLAAQLQSVQSYIEQILGGTIGTIGSGSLNAQSYVQLLPTIWALLSSESIGREAVLNIVVRHAIKLSAASGVKKIATGFLIRLIQLQDLPSYRGSFSLRLLARKPEVRACLDDWLLSLPRYLWELGSKDEDTSIFITNHLRFCAITESVPAAVTPKLQAFLAPYFFSQHSTRGDIPGPFTRLQSQKAQYRALEMAWWLTREGTQDNKLVAAVTQALEKCDDQDLKSVWETLKAS